MYTTCPKCGSWKISSSFDRDAFNPGHDFTCDDCGHWLGDDKITK